MRFKNRIFWQMGPLSNTRIIIHLFYLVVSTQILQYAQNTYNSEEGLYLLTMHKQDLYSCIRWEVSARGLLSYEAPCAIKGLVPCLRVSQQSTWVELAPLQLSVHSLFKLVLNQQPFRPQTKSQKTEQKNPLPLDLNIGLKLLSVF